MFKVYFNTFLLIYALIIVIAKPFKRLLELGDFGRKMPYVKIRHFQSISKQKGFALRRSKDMVCNQEGLKVLVTLCRNRPERPMRNGAGNTVPDSPQSLSFFIKGSSFAL